MACDMMLFRHKTPGEPAGQELQCRIYQTRPTSFLERTVEVTDRVQLVVYPAQFELFFEVPKVLFGSISMAEGLNDRFGSHHSGFHCRMDAFDPLTVQERRTV